MDIEIAGMFIPLDRMSPCQFFDPEHADLADTLEEPENDGFIGVEREGISVNYLDAFDGTVETFTPG